MTSTESIISRNKCIDCGSTSLRVSGGFVVCTNCGTCQDREIVQSTYIMREGTYASPTQFTELGLQMHVANFQGSQIGFSRERQSIINTSKVLRMKRIHHYARLSIEERLMRGLIWINKAVVQLQLPEQTRDRAAYLLRKTLPHFQSFQTPLVIVVLVLAIREHQLPVTEREVLNIIPIRSKHKTLLNKAKFFLMERLEIKWPAPKPEWFIPKLISILRRNPSVLERLERRKGTQDYFNRLERISIKLFQSLSPHLYGGRSADVLAASSVYAIDRCLLNISSQKTIGEGLEVAEFSVRDHHNHLWKPLMPQIKKLLEEDG